MNLKTKHVFPTPLSPKTTTLNSYRFLFIDRKDPISSPLNTEKAVSLEDMNRNKFSLSIGLLFGSGTCQGKPFPSKPSLHIPHTHPLIAENG
jgi:hypothetical protein